MNILFFMNNYPDSRNGGIENVTRILSEQFVKLGHIVHVRYLYDSKFAHSDDTIFESCKQIDIKDTFEEISNCVQIYNIDILINRCVLSATPILRKAISGWKCKLITTYNNKPTLSPPTIKEVIIATETSSIKKMMILLLYPLFAYRSRKKLKRVHQISYNASDYTVLLSELNIPEYSQIMGIDEKKLVYMNNPIRDELKFEPYELESKEKSILMVTRLDERQKCIIKALKIWQKVYNTSPTWKLKIVGSGPDEKRIKKFAQRHNIKNVEFYPAQKPEDFYKKSPIFLLTSRSEGWGNTLIEAMRFACVPIAIATYTAIYDIIDHRKNGIIIRKSSENTEIKDCTNSILELINNKELLNEMAMNACEKTKKFSAKAIVKKWLRLFENILSKF